MRYFLYPLLLFMGICCSFELQAAPAQSSHVQATLIAEDTTIQPGHPFWVALRIDIEKGWHVYWKNPGDAGLPLSLNWSLPEGFQTGSLQWPFPEKFTFDEMVGFGYHNEVLLLAQITPPKTIKPGTPLQLKGQVEWLVCSKENCQPGSAPVQLALNVDSQVPQPDAAKTALFMQARDKMPRSMIQVKTLHKEGVVQLQVPDHLSSAVTGVYFFPEEQNMIDSTVDPLVDKTESSSYVVNLKGGEEIGVKSRNLKGVLVLQTQDKGNNGVIALDIDSPIEGNGDEEFLSFSDGKSMPKIAIGNSAFTTSQQFEGGVGLALVFAFLGGMILNLMPCVLPVMSFKVMSFVKMSRESRTLTMKHGLFFSLGVILSFWVLATAMLMLRAYGQAVGWGFQLQEPLFVVILASILFIFSLNLFGVFEWGLSVASWAGQTEAERSHASSGFSSSFLSGVMATAVATPCTGPFLGSAVGFAVTLPIFQSLMIFTALGLGMCFPYLLLAAFPACLRFIPKPGAWMETFKQLMGFLLLATVLWLLWVFSAQTNTLSLICLIGGFWCFSFGAWVYGRWGSPMMGRTKRIVTYVSVLLIAIAGCSVILMPRSTWYSEELLAQGAAGKWDGWETFSPQRVAELRQQGKPILIDFTAKWCLVCQANHLILSTEDVTKHLDNAGVVRMKADWTRNDPVITEELSKYGRTSVPLYVVYGNDPQKDPVILPQVLTPDIVKDHVNSVIDSEIALR